MRVLGVDQGSDVVGLAVFEGRTLMAATAFKASEKGFSTMPALERRLLRMTALSLRMMEWLKTYQPIDVIGVEDVVVHTVPGRTNIKTTVFMGETRGWLMCTLALTFDPKTVRYLNISPQLVKSAAGLNMMTRREASKTVFKNVSRALHDEAGLPFDEAAEQDQHDAVVVALAVTKALTQEKFEQLG